MVHRCMLIRLGLPVSDQSYESFVDGQNASIDLFWARRVAATAASQATPEEQCGHTCSTIMSRLYCVLAHLIAVWLSSCYQSIVLT